MGILVVGGGPAKGKDINRVADAVGVNLEIGMPPPDCGTRPGDRET